MKRPLVGKVALVAGATRGAGRGISTALGEAGCTVYCTGRSTRAGASEMGRPETIEETAQRVTAAGGQGIPVRADHLVEDDVRSVVERVAREQGRLDVVVNDIWGGEALIEWNRPFWQLDVAKIKKLLDQAVLSHIITARHAVPMMVAARRGLVVEITDGDGAWYRGNLAYDLVKTTVIRLAWDFAEELRPHGVAAVAVTPGFLRSEFMLDHFGVTERNWRDAATKDRHFLHSETPLYVGRAVANLAADPNVMKKSGRAFASWTLAEEYGFADADGTRPDFAAHLEEEYGSEIRRLQPRLDDTYFGYMGDWRALQRMFAKEFESMGALPRDSPPSG